MQILPTISLAAERELGLKSDPASLQSDADGFALKLRENVSEHRARDRQPDKDIRDNIRSREDWDTQQPAKTAARGKEEAFDREEPVSREAFAAVKQALRKAGVDEEVLAKLEERFQEAKDMDWQELAGAIWELLQQMEELPVFSVMEAAPVQDILAEIGLAKPEMADLTKAFQENRPEIWIGKLTQALRGLSQSKDREALQQTILSLGRAMGLSKEDMARLSQLLGGQKELTSERMRSALHLLFDEAQGLRQSREAAQPGKHQLMRMLGQMESDAATLGKQGEEKISRLVQALKQILDSASGQGEQARQLTASQMNPSKEASEAMLHALHKGGPASRSEAGEQAATRQLQSQHISHGEQLQEKSGQEQGSQRFGENSGKEKERAWEALWSRVTKTTEEGSGMQDRGIGSLQQKMDSLLKESLGRGEASSRETLRHPEVRQGILRQVQSGLLRGIGQGRQELTLKLHPPELGRLHVVLQVHQNQVSAMIKTDNPDVTRALQHQLAGLQHHLEQQGLKVQKIDVQTQLSQQDQSGQQWFGEHGHNEAREQRDKMEKRSWWQRWRGAPDTEDEMVHPQEEALQHTATQGLSVIA